MDFEKVVASRRMVRRYRPDPVPREQLERILHLARRAPSAGFSQGQSLVVVQDHDLRTELARIAREPHYVSKGFDPWISQAPVHVVVCTNEAAYHERYREPDKLDPRGKERPWPVPFWYVDAGCSVMLLLLAAVNEGLAGGLLGFGEAASAQVRALLGIPSDMIVIGLITIGTGAPDRRSSSLERGWRDPAEVIHWERW